MSKKVIIIIAIVAILIGLGVYRFIDNRGKENVSNSDSSVTISPESLNDARTNMYYLQTFYTTGFVESGDLSWSIASGTIPSGLVLESDTRGCFDSDNCPPIKTSRGLLSGAVTGQPGIYDFTIKVTNGEKTGQQSYQLVVN